MTDNNKASWLQLTLETNAQRLEAAEDALWQAGAIAVTLQDAGDDPVFEPLPGSSPLWPRTRVTGLFDAQTDIEALAQRLRCALGNEDYSGHRLENLQEQNWVRAWLEHFQPMRFGKRLWVCPVNHPPPDPNAVNLFLDPGLAFGTGAHPTTALCLTWLDNAELLGKTVIDYGCGSGILAIAAAKLGARQVWAVDSDPQALLTSSQNASANAVAERIVVVSPNELLPIKADIVLANILADPLIALAPRVAQLVCAPGQLVLSGILVQQAEAVQTAYRSWFEFSDSQQREEWLLLQAIRKS